MEFHCSVTMVAAQKGVASALGSIAHAHKNSYAPAATRYHSITNEMLNAHGVTLCDAMSAFIADLKLSLDDGGRLVAHHLEFDAGHVYAELCRLVTEGLLIQQDSDTFKQAATNGFCTMEASVQ